MARKRWQPPASLSGVEREEQLAERVLSNPLIFPSVFKNWILNHISENPVPISWDSIVGAPGAGGTLDVETGVGSISNNSNEADLYLFSLPANILGSMGAVRVIIHGDIENQTGSAKGLTLRVYYGADKLFDDSTGNAFPSSTTILPFRIEFDLVADGSDQNQLMNGEVHMQTTSAAATAGKGDLASTTAIAAVIAGSCSEDSAAIKDIKVTVQLSAASTSLICRRLWASVSKL